MGREKKSEREKRQAAGFLRDHVAYDDLECVNPDPPDIRVWHNGSAVLDLELTEYHIDDEKVGISIRWAEKLWPKVDELRRKDNTLANIHGFIIFSNSKLPGLRKNEADQFASELVKLAAQVGPMLGDAG